MKVLGGSARGRRRLLRDLAAVSAVTVGVVALSSGAAFAAPGSFTWSGNGSDSVWSDGANWAGGTAPQPKASADLTFPDLACSAACNSDIQNDVTGLKVPALSLALGTETNFGDYNIGGNGIKIGGLDVTSSVPNNGSAQGASLSVPMTLTGSESWSVDLENDSNFDLGTVAGANGDSLSVDLPVGTPGNGGGFINFPSINTGPLTFQGSGGATTYVTGSDFNGTSKEPVKIVNAGLFVIGAFGSKKVSTIPYGPLTTKGASIQFGNGSSGPYGIDSVEGAASFDSATHLTFNSLDPGTGAKPTPGGSYPQLVASGAVKLGSASLGIYADCNQAVGTKYTIVSGSSIKGTFSGLANGATFQAGPDGSAACQPEGSVAPTFKITYSSTAVTATVVATPPAASPADTSAAQPVAHELSDGAMQIGG
jgi:hypothetical protein